MATIPDDIPPAPETRVISPAPDEYAARPTPRMFGWPLLWYGALVALTAILVRYGWHAFTGH